MVEQQQSSSAVARLGTTDDFSKLEDILKQNCTRMQLDWANYAPVAKKILGDEDMGKFVIAEHGDSIVGFLFVTYEWSDWRDGVFFWLQGCEVAAESSEAEIVPLMKQKLEEYAESMGDKCCGIRLCSQKVLKTEVESFIKLFELSTSHYYIYHVDTPTEVKQ